MIKNLQLTPTQTSIGATWQVTSTGGKAINITLTAGASTISQATLAPTATTYTFSNLSPGTAYGVNVTYIAAGASKTVTTLPGVTPPPPPTGRAFGGFQCAIGSSAALGTPVQDFLIVQSWRTDLAKAAKAANPACKVLMYKESAACQNASTAIGSVDSGVTYAQASAAGWLLENGSTPYTLNGYAGQYAADISNGAYQNAWAANVIGLLQTNAGLFDGVFADDVNSSINGGPSDYQARMTSWVNSAGAEVAENYLVVGNIGAWFNNRTVSDGWAKTLSGGMDEMFFGWPNTGGMGKQGTTTAENQMGEVALCAQEDKIFLAVCQATTTDTLDETYCLAGLMLGADSPNQAIMFANGQNYNTTSWPPLYANAAKLGMPTGGYTASGQTYTREFQGGYVQVNFATESGLIVVS